MQYRDYNWREIITTNRYGAEWIVRNVPQFDHETCEVKERWECMPVRLPIDFPARALSDKETAVITAMREDNLQKAIEFILSEEEI